MRKIYALHDTIYTCLQVYTLYGKPHKYIAERNIYMKQFWGMS